MLGPVDDGKTPLWIRGDSNRGLAIWPVEDGAVLSVHLDSEQTDLHLTTADMQALFEALTPAYGDQGTGPLAPQAPPGDYEITAGRTPSEPVVTPDIPQIATKSGPPCDRCKNETIQTSDGYACTHCGNTIVWV